MHLLTAAGLLVLPGFFGYNGCVTFVTTCAIVVVIVYIYPGHDPHTSPEPAAERPTGCLLYSWLTESIRVVGLSAAQLRLVYMACGCLWQARVVESDMGRLNPTLTMHRSCRHL